jgi:N-acetylglutamate synthase-like GNAT family acetyltransferase
MTISEPSPEDWPALRALAVRLGLGYEDMEGDRFWIAGEAGYVAGLVGLKKHPDCLELVSLGVDPAFRSRGLGGRLVERLAASAGGAVYLATIIPEYFARHGFEPAPDVPAGMAKNPEWCVGCPKTGCTVMVRRSR